MKTSHLLGRTFLALFCLQIPTHATACIVHFAPNICDEVAQSSSNWIGEYSGETIDFNMLMDGQPFDPNFERHGTMTIFQLSDALGFSGGGAFQGEANLSRSTDTGRNSVADNEEWNWLLEDEMWSTVQSLTESRSQRHCPLEKWPRWSANYHPPNSPPMKLTLIAIRWNIIIGRAYFSNGVEGRETSVDSRFFLENESYDTSGWQAATYPTGSNECQLFCLSGTGNVCTE